MKTLHTFSKGMDNKTFRQCIASMEKNDDLLFIGNGVFCAIADTLFHEILLGKWEKPHVFCLKPDVIARGIGNKLMPEAVMVDYAGFVTLSEKNERVISWY